MRLKLEKGKGTLHSQAHSTNVNVPLLSPLAPLREHHPHSSEPLILPPVPLLDRTGVKRSEEPRLPRPGDARDAADVPPGCVVFGESAGSDDGVERPPVRGGGDGLLEEAGGLGEGAGRGKVG